MPLTLEPLPEDLSVLWDQVLTDTNRQAIDALGETSYRSDHPEHEADYSDRLRDDCGVERLLPVHTLGALAAYTAIRDLLPLPEKVRPAKLAHTYLDQEVARVGLWQRDNLDQPIPADPSPVPETVDSLMELFGKTSLLLSSGWRASQKTHESQLERTKHITRDEQNLHRPDGHEFYRAHLATLLGFHSRALEHSIDGTAFAQRLDCQEKEITLPTLLLIGLSRQVMIVTLRSCLPERVAHRLLEPD